MTSVLLFCLFLGVLSGLRSFTPIAVVTWAAHLGWLNLAGSPLAFLAIHSEVLRVPINRFYLAVERIRLLICGRLPKASRSHQRKRDKDWNQLI